MSANGSSAIPPPGPLIGTATVRAPGVCGELAQGVLANTYFLVTCPVDFFSRVRVDVFESGGVEASEGCPKTAAAVRRTLAHLKRAKLGVKVQVNSPIPRSKGMGSSSADLAAAIAATGLALGERIAPEAIAQIALSIEPTDGVMMPGLALFDHRAGLLRESLGPPPPMEIVALDLGGTVDTVEFNRVDRTRAWISVSDQSVAALRLVRRGIEEQDPALVGEGATMSAQAGQRIMRKQRLDDVIAFAQDLGAVGVNVGHSGTIMGILLDARERRGKSSFLQAQRAFPEAEMIYHFRMLGGGVHPVTTAN